MADFKKKLRDWQNKEKRLVKALLIAEINEVIIHGEHDYIVIKKELINGERTVEYIKADNNDLVKHTVFVDRILNME
ncbi:hypothetical protein [Tenacibaculum jejuense]|uniref:hypothetical protein n=1 Tax=Tenacibaculum jejuense TaxID=584609 RepID=UPI000BA4C3AE|nr:hypothetical protein [Tenacibaculum jejuense]